MNKVTEEIAMKAHRLKILEQERLEKARMDKKKLFEDYAYKDSIKPLGSIIPPKEFIDSLKEDYRGKFMPGTYPDKSDYDGWKISHGSGIVVKRPEPPETMVPIITREQIVNLLQDTFSDLNTGTENIHCFAQALLYRLEVTYDGNFNIRIKPD